MENNVLEVSKLLKNLDIIGEKGLVFFEKKFYLSELILIMGDLGVNPSLDNVAYLIKNNITKKIDEEINNSIDEIMKNNIDELKKNGEIK